MRANHTALRLGSRVESCGSYCHAASASGGYPRACPAVFVGQMKQTAVLPLLLPVLRGASPEYQLRSSKLCRGLAHQALLNMPVVSRVCRTIAAAPVLCKRYVRTRFIHM